MPIRDKICDENIIGDPQASVQTLNGALTMLLRTSYEWRTVCVKVRHLTNSNKCVNVEHLHVLFRDSRTNPDLSDLRQQNARQRPLRRLDRESFRANLAKSFSLERSASCSLRGLSATVLPNLVSVLCVCRKYTITCSDMVRNCDLYLVISSRTRCNPPT